MSWTDLWHHMQDYAAVIRQTLLGRWSHNGHTPEMDVSIEARALPLALPPAPEPVPPTPPSERVVVPTLVEEGEEAFCERFEREHAILPDDSWQNDVNEPESTRWHLRGEVLDRLAEYFICFKRLRHVDYHAYQLFSRVGFAIPADQWINGGHPTNQRLAVHTSIGGCLVVRPKDDDPEHITPSFIYYEKIARPVRVQPFAGTIYRVSVLFDERDAKHRWASKLQGLGVCHIGVQPDNQCVLLREALHTQREITVGKRAGRGKRHGKETLVLTGRTWGLPWWLDGVSGEHHRTPQEWTTRLFLMAALTYQSTIEKILVRVTDGDCHGTLGLDLARGKYFFADRDATVLSPSGKKIRIFHAVRQHTRQTKKGVTVVRDHYRGSRDFTWKGYGVHIVLPKLNKVLDVNLPGRYPEDLDASERHEYVSQRVAGQIIGSVLER